MKKKILSAILMAAMLLSMTGCGGNNTIRKTELTNVVTDDYLDTNISEYEDDIHISENITPLDHSDFDYQSSDLGSNEESVYENEDYITFEEAYPDINFSESEPVSDFRGGIAYVRAPVKSDYHNLTFAINTKGEILCECKNDELSKYCIPQYSRDVGNGSMIFDYYLVNMDGKILASPTEDGYDQFAECELAYDRYSQYDNWYKTEDGYLIAIKTEKKFDGDIHSIGVLNDRGDWIVPMSSELEVFDYVDSFSSYIYLGNGFISIKKRSDYFSSSCVIYDFLNDEVICVIDGDCSPIIAVDNYIFFEDESYNLCKIDTQTKEILETSFNAARCYFDNAFLYKDRSKDDIYYLYNYNFECILTINYEIHSGYCYSDDRFSALCYGKDDDTYLCLFNNDGTFAFEPIHVEPGYNVYISNEHILYMGNWNTAIYDFNGNLTSEFDGYNLNLDKESGILRSSGLSAYSDRNCFFDIDGNRMSISAKSEVPEDGTSPYNDLFTNS